MKKSQKDRLVSATCSCNTKNLRPKLVVLTGGPGAGKTAVLEIARRHFCEHVAVLPEAASIVFGGGFIRKETISARKAAQRAIFQVQRELERLMIDENKYSVILCDRGTIDGLAYWPNSDESFWKENQTTRKAEFKKYSAVIHLKTPTLGQGYNHQNPIRVETPAQAADLDERITQVWAGHPHQHLVNSSPEFVHKVSQALKLIAKELSSGYSH